MICFPNAKINLGLRVLRKRADGYHDIETVFFPIPLCDVLELVAIDQDFKGDHFLNMPDSHRLYYSYSGDTVIDNPENELTVKAILAYAREFGVSTDLFMHLHKQIPFGAGLGGGSSDASSALKTISVLEGEKVDKSSLLNLSASIGSDCPFFILNEPCHAEGRGELLKPTPVLLSGFYLVLVKPAFGVSTAEAYSHVIPNHNLDAPSLIEIIKMPVDTWKDCLINDFEKGVFELFPRLAEIKNTFYEAGALYASMSGSGSTMFGLFRNEPLLDNLFRDCFVFKTKL